MLRFRTRFGMGGIVVWVRKRNLEWTLLGFGPGCSGGRPNTPLGMDVKRVGALFW